MTDKTSNFYLRSHFSFLFADSHDKLSRMHFLLNFHMACKDIAKMKIAFRLHLTKVSQGFLCSAKICLTLVYINWPRVNF